MKKRSNGKKEKSGREEDNYQKEGCKRIRREIL